MITHAHLHRCGAYQKRCLFAKGEGGANLGSHRTTFAVRFRVHASFAHSIRTRIHTRLQLLSDALFAKSEGGGCLDSHRTFVVVYDAEEEGGDVDLGYH